MEQPTSIAAIRRGTVIGDRYRITGTLGRGGFGRVFSATHLHMKRELALKILDFSKVDINHDELSRRFIQEAESAAKIDHPNVVTIYDFGFTKVGQNPYIAMQLLEGQDLDKTLRQAPIGTMRSLRLVVDCLDALAEAHRLGIVHKDLKPGNLFLVRPQTRRERLCIVDFGLAFAAEANLRLTAQGQFVGTPQFASPEYLEHQITTPALDVYQMGLILVEMLTGRPVLKQANFYKCVMAHTKGELPLPKVLMESPLGEVLRTALHTDYRLRYQNAMLFRDALESIDPASIPDDVDMTETVMLCDYIEVPSYSEIAGAPRIGGIQLEGDANMDTYVVTVNTDAQSPGFDPAATAPNRLYTIEPEETVLLGSAALPNPSSIKRHATAKKRSNSAVQVVRASVIRRALQATAPGAAKENTADTQRSQSAVFLSVVGFIILGLVGILGFFLWR